jgi:hypothetical protein
MSNVLHFSDLSAPMQDKLIRYIGSRYNKCNAINHAVSAYGLKQHFTALAASEDEHVTSQCFKEAMEACGFRAVLREGTTSESANWEFNVYVLKHPRDSQ